MRYLPEDLSFITPVNYPNLIRLGNDRDGGYIVPEMLLNEVDVLVSLGVSDDWSFDQHFQKMNGRIKIHAYDHTISKMSFLYAILVSILKFLLGRSNISQVIEKLVTYRAYSNFFRDRNIHYAERVHNRVDKEFDITFDHIMERTQDGNVFLKIDIEGSEYRMLSDISHYSSRIPGMVIEFHDTDPYRSVFMSKFSELLLKYSPVHIHPNNYGGIAEDGFPEVLEVTFLRKDLVRDFSLKSGTSQCPMDRPNNPNKEEIVIFF